MAKKTTIVLALAFVFVLALSSYAFAAVGDSGFTWDSARGTNAGTGTPHVGFSTTTYKCGVCHTVHGAPANSEILLSSTVSGACVACHLDGVNAIKDVYQSTPANWNTDTRANHSSAGGYGLDCIDCHGVHGAFCVTAAGWEGYILSAQTSMLSGTSGGQGVPNGGLVAGTNASAVLSNYCTQCHGYYAPGYDGVGGAAASHVMTDVAGNYGNALASAAARSGSVAGADSFYCTSCHDIAGSSVSSATAATAGFPHNVPSVDRFMKVAGYVGGSATNALLDATHQDAESDGACIKCHLYGTAGDAGVGISW